MLNETPGSGVSALVKVPIARKTMLERESARTRGNSNKGVAEEGSSVSVSGYWLLKIRKHGHEELHEVLHLLTSVSLEQPCSD
jgi:hypothetical protein